MEEGVGIDGSSIRGFMPIEASDMVARLDPATFAILPWREDYRVARVIADIHHPDGRPFEGDPRLILKGVIQKAREQGFVPYVGVELEYFYFWEETEPEPIDRSGYFDLLPDDRAAETRCLTIELLEKMGIQIECTHHEVAPSQHEIDLRYADALTMADSVMTCRYVIKTVAKRHGVYATFMPKPIANQNGSGMHTHMSLFAGDKNAFFDASDPAHLSSVGRRFIAGLLRHAREITLLCNQWVNSYKRLVQNMLNKGVKAPSSPTIPPKSSSNYVIYRCKRAFLSSALTNSEISYLMTNVNPGLGRPAGIILADGVGYMETSSEDVAHYYSAALNYLVDKIFHHGRRFVHNQFGRPLVALIEAGLTWRGEGWQKKIGELSRSLHEKALDALIKAYKPTNVEEPIDLIKKMKRAEDDLRIISQLREWGDIVSEFDSNVSRRRISAAIQQVTE